MSEGWYRWVFDHSAARRIDRLVHIALAYLADDDGLTEVTLPELCNMAASSPRRTRQAIAQLAAAGFVHQLVPDLDILRFQLVPLDAEPAAPQPPGKSIWAQVPIDGFYVYRLWQPDGRLLYVGVSTVLRNRLRTHRQRWNDLWTVATWDRYPTAAAMLAAEAVVIVEEHPALNRAGVGP